MAHFRASQEASDGEAQVGHFGLFGPYPPLGLTPRKLLQTSHYCTTIYTPGPGLVWFVPSGQFIQLKGAMLVFEFERIKLYLLTSFL